MILHCSFDCIRIYFSYVFHHRCFRVAIDYDRTNLIYEILPTNIIIFYKIACPIFRIFNNSL